MNSINNNYNYSKSPKNSKSPTQKRITKLTNKTDNVLDLNDVKSLNTNLANKYKLDEFKDNGDS